MEWRIRESSHGGYVAEYGGQISGNIENPCGTGYFMPGFHVSESIRFDTKAQALSYINRKVAKATRIN